MVEALRGRGPARAACWATGAERHAQRGKPHSNSLWQGDLGPEALRLARHGYYGNVSFIDEQIGRILDGPRSAAPGQHADPVHRRPRRHAGRPPPVAQDLRLRALGADSHARALARVDAGHAGPGDRPAGRAPRPAADVPRCRPGQLRPQAVRRAEPAGAGPRPERRLARVHRPGARHRATPRRTTGPA